MLEKLGKEIMMKQMFVWVVKHLHPLLWQMYHKRMHFQSVDNEVTTSSLLRLQHLEVELPILAQHLHMIHAYGQNVQSIKTEIVHAHLTTASS